MKPNKSLWKKIEHWIVVALFVGTILLGLITNIFWKELGMMPPAPSEPGDTSTDCPPDPRYPC